VTTTWVRKEVADEQLQFVREEWTNIDRLRPYWYFAKVMAGIDEPNKRLLDVGCGVGHYGRFCQHFFPQVDYAGCDLSDFMIEHARSFAPLGRFSQCDILDAPYAGRNVLLFSGVLEYTEDPFATLAKCLGLADDNAWVILHRIRLTGHQSRPIPEKTYFGYTENHYLWNQTELFSFLAPLLTGVRHIEWYDDSQSTIAGRVIP